MPPVLPKLPPQATEKRVDSFGNILTGLLCFAIGGAVLLIAGVIWMWAVANQCQQAYGDGGAGCGDAFLFLLLPFALEGILAVIYCIASVIYVVMRASSRQSYQKRHLIGVIGGSVLLVWQLIPFLAFIIF